MRVIVCGGRDYHDRDAVFSFLDRIESDVGEITTLVHGAAKGADSIAADWAEFRCIADEPHYPDYNNYPGWQAPKVRNQRMADLGADLCIAFPGGGGTKDMISRATEKGILIARLDSDLSALQPKEQTP